MEGRSGLPADAVTTVALDPANPATVYACMSEGLYQSKDSGVTWKALLTGPVTSVAAAATQAGLIYAGRASAPILRSQDGGVNWQEVGAAVSVNALAIDPTNALIVYAATSRSGIYLSNDGGTTWAYSNTGLTRGSAPLPIYALAIDPRIPQRLYAGTANGLYRSNDWGSDWTPGGTGIGTRPVLSLAINPLDANYVYAGTARGGVFQSVDGGDNWASTGPANLDANAVAVDSAARFVYAGLYLGTQAFVTKVNPGGNALVYSTYIGGSGNTDGRGIAVDGAGHTYVCGATDAADFPTRNAYQASIGGSRDVFFLRLNISGSDLDYSSFFGGHGDDVCEVVALDPDGNVYLAGNTYAMPTGVNDFPTTLGAFQRAGPGGDQDCFVSKFDDTGHRLTYSTYLGGVAVDACYGMAVDRSGNVYLAGMTNSPNFPLRQPSLGGTIPSPPVMNYSSGFVTILNSDGADLSKSALLGGLKGDTEVNGLALSPARPGLFDRVHQSLRFPADVKRVVHADFPERKDLCLRSRSRFHHAGVFHRAPRTRSRLRRKDPTRRSRQRVGDRDRLHQPVSDHAGRHRSSGDIRPDSLCGPGGCHSFQVAPLDLPCRNRRRHRQRHRPIPGWQGVRGRLYPVDRFSILDRSVPIGEERGLRDLPPVPGLHADSAAGGARRLGSCEWRKLRGRIAGARSGHHHLRNQPGHRHSALYIGSAPDA